VLLQGLDLLLLGCSSGCGLVAEEDEVANDAEQEARWDVANNDGDPEEDLCWDDICSNDGLRQSARKNVACIRVGLQGKDHLRVVIVKGGVVVSKEDVSN